MEIAGVALFGPFAFDVSRGELRREGEPVALAPQAAQVLALLIRHSDRVLLREEILTAVWGPMGRASSDARLNSCIRRLRRALEDDAKAPFYIETVHKRGYRFRAEVGWAPISSPSVRRPSVRHRRTLRAGLAASAVVACGALVVTLILPGAGPSEVPAEWETSYLRARHLATRGSPAEVRMGKATLLDLTRVAPGLSGAWSALAVAEVRLDEPARAEEYARKALGLNRTSAEAHRVLSETALGLRWDLDEAESHVLRAIKLDPRSPMAHSTCAYVLALRGQWDRAVAEARRALALDPMLTLVAGDLAHFLFWARRYGEAIEQARRALVIEPDYAPAFAVIRLALLANGDTAAAAIPTRRLIELANDPEFLEDTKRATPAELQTRFLNWQAQRALSRTRPERWVQLAAVRAELGDLAGAAEAGQSALAEGAPGLPMLLVDPRLDVLNRTGAFALLQKAVHGRGGVFEVS